MNGWKTSSAGIGQNIKIWPYNHIIYVYKTEYILEKETPIIIWEFEIQPFHQILVWRLDLMSIGKKKRTNHLMDFALSADHRMKNKSKQNVRQIPGS